MGKEKPKMAYAMQLSSLEDFAIESEEKILVYADLIKDYLDKEPQKQSPAILSMLCQGLTLSYQMMDVVGSTLIEPVFMDGSTEKVMVLEEDMYLIETIALSQIYCESQEIWRATTH